MKVAALCGAALVAATSGLLPPPAFAAGPTAAGKTPTYTGHDSGRTIHAAAGHRFRLSLKTDRDGGYSWSFAHRPDRHIVKVVRKRVRPDRHPAGTVGYGYHTVYVFAAASAGSTSMRLRERRSFGARDVARRFHATVHVTKH